MNEYPTYQFVLPISPLRPHIGEFESELDKLAGGFTKWGGAGHWQGDYELIWVYQVSLAPHKQSSLYALLQKWGRILDQEAIYIGQTGFHNVVLVGG